MSTIQAYLMHILKRRSTMYGRLHSFKQGLRLMRVFYPMIIALAVLIAGSLQSPLVGQAAVAGNKIITKVNRFKIRISDLKGVRPNLPPRDSVYLEQVVTNFLFTMLIDACFATTETRRKTATLNFKEA